MSLLPVKLLTSACDRLAAACMSDLFDNALLASNAVQEFRLKNKAESVGSSQKVEIPPELICHKCKELVKDAVIIPCCGESFCDECESSFEYTMVLSHC